MWDQGYSEPPGGFAGQKTMLKRAALQILPCAVSQLLSVSEVNDVFLLANCEVSQVSVVGVIREFVPFVSNIEYSLDDMTGPPIDVKQWVNTEDSGVMWRFTPGTYVKVSGSLRNSKGKRLLLANNIRCIEDFNEITSHMLEVVQAHMQLFGKVPQLLKGFDRCGILKAVDMNMNTITTSVPETVEKYMCSDGGSEGILANGLSIIQDQVLSAIKRCSLKEGINFQNLTMQLGSLSIKDIRNSLRFLLNEGHIFSTIDEHHFKATGI